MWGQCFQARHEVQNKEAFELKIKHPVGGDNKSD